MASSNFYYSGLSVPLALQATVHTEPSRTNLGIRSDSDAPSQGMVGRDVQLLGSCRSLYVRCNGCSTVVPSSVIHIFIGGCIYASVIDQDVRAETSRRLFLLKKSKTNGEDDDGGALIQRSS